MRSNDRKRLDAYRLDAIKERRETEKKGSTQKRSGKIRLDARFTVGNGRSERRSKQKIK